MICPARSHKIHTDGRFEGRRQRPPSIRPLRKLKSKVKQTAYVIRESRYQNSHFIYNPNRTAAVNTRSSTLVENRAASAVNSSPLVRDASLTFLLYLTLLTSITVSRHVTPSFSQYVDIIMASALCTTMCPGVAHEYCWSHITRAYRCSRYTSCSCGTSDKCSTLMQISSSGDSAAVDSPGSPPDAIDVAELGVGNGDTDGSIDASSGSSVPFGEAVSAIGTVEDSDGDGAVEVTNTGGVGPTTTTVTDGSAVTAGLDAA